ncbi:unnamed protein product [Adineta steineri]|uniref:G-protein coupled receptors family 1 profile domain-containing protein n=1 Tax=Adineta steineri TaxID=433720 RepID=A0A816F771_9BILA|nr:unnamed protein product [Adineta steineri]CAF1656997.1 unnamed protein product [Adineta steineri]
MSSATLTAIQNQINIYGNAFLMVMGNIGNVLIIMIFSQQHKSACSFYIMSAAVVNFIFLTINAYFQIFPFDYSTGTTGSIIFCKVSAYILNIFGQLAKTLLVFACIDRFLITSDRASFRAFSTLKRAKYLVFLSCIFWSVLPLHVPIMRTVVNGRCGASGIYSTIFALIFVCLFPSMTLTIFGSLAYYNLKKLQNRVHPLLQNTNNQNNTFQRRDRNLLIIVFSEVFTYIITSILYPVILLETTISQYVVLHKSAQYSQIESFLLTIGYLLLFSNSAIPFYSYYIGSKSFQRDVKKLIINIYQKITKQLPSENVSTTNRILTQRDIHV